MKVYTSIDIITCEPNFLTGKCKRYDQEKLKEFIDNAVQSSGSLKLFPEKESFLEWVKKPSSHSSFIDKCFPKKMSERVIVKLELEIDCDDLNKLEGDDVSEFSRFIGQSGVVYSCVNPLELSNETEIECEHVDYKIIRAEFINHGKETEIDYTQTYKPTMCIIN